MSKTGVAAAASANAQVFSSDALARRTVERRAVEAVIWGTPAVNFDVMYQAMVRDAKSGDGSNKVVYWSRLFDWNNQTRTCNVPASRHRTRSCGRVQTALFRLYGPEKPLSDKSWKLPDIERISAI